MTLDYTNVIDRVPAGQHGEASIVHDVPSDFERLMGRMHGQPLERERYARLLLNGSVMMTDAEFERRTNRGVLTNAKGDVLIAGLGLGLILDPVCARADSVTVVEKSADVIALVGPAFSKATLVHKDIFEYRTTKQFDTIYFDIWPDICEDDRAEANRLERRFRKNLRPGGWMSSWCKVALSTRRR